jgi:hypothetical protein
MELGNTKSAVDDLTSQLNGVKIKFKFVFTNKRSKRMNLISTDRTSEIVDIGKMPTSCSDPQRMGHKISGFFSVKGPKKKMEMVYCDFYPNRNGTTCSFLYWLLIGKIR